MQDKSNSQKQTHSQTESNKIKTDNLGDVENKESELENKTSDVVNNTSTNSAKPPSNSNVDNAHLDKQEPDKPEQVIATDQVTSSSEQLDDILNQTSRINQQLAQLHQHKMIKAYNSIPHLLWFNLLKGTAFGLGSVLGATVVLSVVVYLLSQIEFIPFIGEWVSAILEVVKAPAAD